MVDQNRCTGCSACAAGCPAGAIQMVQDPEGFLQPEIQKNKCNGCGLCRRICPVSGSIKHEEVHLAYLAYNWKAKVRQESSSGGMFHALSERVLAEGGVVYGCAMTEDCYTAHHTQVSELHGLENLRGSKYVQSEMGDTLKEARKAVREGRKVLFTGTPCQISGLKSLLGDREYENLVLVDVICHGVPSPLVWQAYVRQREQEFGAKVCRVSFRDKVTGWKRYSLTMDFEDGSRYSCPVNQDPYLRGFIQNLYLRRSCYSCTAKDGNYRSDITLGDFWGIQRIKPELEQSSGVSLVIAHTSKGQNLLASLAQACCLEPVDFALALRSNPSYFRRAEKNGLRDWVIQKITQKGTKQVLDQYCSDSILARCRRKIGQILGG